MTVLRTKKASELIAEFSVGFDPASITQAARQTCGRSLADLHAGAVAGWNEPAARRVRAYIGAGASGDAGLWCGGRSSIEGAALANGVAAHVLDYDDVASPMRGHPSVALWPALLALGEARGLNGTRLTSAYIVGFEVIVKLSRAMVQKHYARGWHSTATVGTIACAVACCHLLELDVASTVNAIGLAVAQTAGTRQNFGSDAKSFQAGQANAAALRAVLLAETGFTSSADAIDGAVGFMALYASGEDLAGQLSELGKIPLEIERSGLEIKKYPMCYAAHRSLDGLLDLRSENGLTLDDIESVDVQASRDSLVPLIHHRPQTGLEARFSMEYAMATGLLDGAVGLSSFLDEAVQRPALQNFLAKVRASEAGDALFPRWAEVTLHCKSGVTLRKRVDVLRGSAEKPLTADELLAKMTDCYRFGNCDIDAGKLLGNAMAFEHLAIKDILNVSS